MADVRLRINFHEELFEIEQNRTSTVIVEKVDTLLDSVGNNVDDYLSSNDVPDDQAHIISEQKGIFEDTVNTLKSNPILDTGIIPELTSAFEEFVLSISPNALDIEPYDETPLNEMDSKQDLNSENPFQDFISNLREIFNTALDELPAILNDTTILPNISESEGNGKAYDKFLSVYNDMITNNSLSDSESIEITL